MRKRIATAAIVATGALGLMAGSASADLPTGPGKGPGAHPSYASELQGGSKAFVCVHGIPGGALAPQCEEE